MVNNEDPEQEIIDSWKTNVHAWTNAVREDEIESRLLVTNQAIIDAVLSVSPKTALDIGCGEGWLVRELTGRGIDTLGVDIVPQFVTLAEQEGIGRFQTLSYEEVSQKTLKQRFDLVVCNFSLLGKESVTHIFQSAQSLLNKDGSLIVQTIHPAVACGEGEYLDGWRAGSWQGFSESFVEPPPWFFRTIESWKSLFLDNGFILSNIEEPPNPQTSAPASIIFTGTQKN